MGKCESATASIGIKILLSDLILQINETNFELIDSMLYNGFIEDENGYSNQVYMNIIYNEYNPNNYVHAKEYLINAFIHKGSLLDQHLLIPIKKLLSCERWGYNREGTNSTSRTIDFDLSVNIEPYKDIQKMEIVFILKQSSN